MKLAAWLMEPKNRLDVVMGFCDGILTALILTAASVLDSAKPMSLSLVFRVAGAAGVSGVFVFFVGHYASLRGDLVEAERQLNLTSHGRLASSRLGRVTLLNAMQGALLASVCSFCGAILPLIIGIIVPNLRWLAVVVALITLALLGVLIARAVYGKPLMWGLGLVVGGMILTYIGAKLDIA